MEDGYSVRFRCYRCGELFPDFEKRLHEQLLKVYEATKDAERKPGDDE